MARKFLTPIDLNKLELQNAAFQNLGVAPGTPSTGQFYYDTSASPYVLKVYNGSTWVTVGSTEEEIEDIVGGLIAAGSGISVDYNDGSNTLTIGNTGVTSLAGTTNEVEVSASVGAVTLSLPSTINANTTGNAATATALQTARTISISGDASASASFDGTGNIDLVLNIDSNSAVSSITGTANEIDVSASVGAVVLSLPSTINADTTGNAATASALQTARNISLGGDLSGSASFSGASDITINAYLAADSIALGTDTTGSYVADLVAGSGISISGSGGESASATITNTGVTSLAGTASEVEVSASAGAVTLSLPSTINADTTGNASTASTLQNSRTISLGGDLSGSASFNGGSDITITAAIGANSVALGTDTTGNYVGGITGTENEIEVTGSGSEGASVTIGLPDNVTITGNLLVSGALTVSGSATYVNTEIIELADNTIILNSNATGAASQDAGIEVERGDDPNVSILWSEGSDVWTLTNNGTNYHAIARKYSTNVGNSASTQFTVTHNLGTRDVEVQVYDNATYDTVETDVVRTNTSSVTITFATAPTTDAYRVVVIG